MSGMCGLSLEVTDLRVEPPSRECPRVSSDAAAFFRSVKKFRMATHVLDAEALKRGASQQGVSRLHDELARGAPVLERLIADGLAGRFSAEEVDILNWKEMLKRAQDLQLKLRKRLNQRAARSSAAPAMAEERQEESWAAMEALPRSARIEIFEVEEQLVSKKIAERLPRAQPSQPWSGLRRRARSWTRPPESSSLREPAGHCE